MKPKDNNQYILCSEFKNHPKMDVNFCRGCESNINCQVYQSYVHPEPPWVKDDAVQTGRAMSTSDLPPLCSKCQHFIMSKRGNEGLRCAAYPEKIPTEILLGYVSHDKPYRGDQGIRFEPFNDPDEEKRRIKKLRG